VPNHEGTYQTVSRSAVSVEISGTQVLIAFISVISGKRFWAFLRVSPCSPRLRGGFWFLVVAPLRCVLCGLKRSYQRKSAKISGKKVLIFSASPRWAFGFALLSVPPRFPSGFWFFVCVPSCFRGRFCPCRCFSNCKL